MSQFLTAIFAIAVWELLIRIYTEVCHELRRPHRREVITLEIDMATTQVTVGIPEAFVVNALNAAGLIVADSGITVTVDNGTASISTDGSAGTFTAATPGPVTLTATDGKLTTTSSVTAVAAVDNTPASLSIVLA